MGDNGTHKTGDRIRDAIMNIASPGGITRRALNATTQMVEQLGIAIVAGEYPQGALIPLDPDLEEMFGVSRTVVREAKKTLVAKGLLKSKAKVGTRVQPATEWSMFDPDVLRWHTSVKDTSDFVTELSEIRQIFEPEAAALAARNRDERDISQLRRHFDRLANAPTYEHFIAADMEFHRAILQASGNRFLRSLGDMVEATLLALIEHEVRAVPEKGGRGFADLAAEHNLILEAIERGDPEAAQAAMQRVVRICS